MKILIDKRVRPPEGNGWMIQGSHNGNFHAHISAATVDGVPQTDDQMREAALAVVREKLNKPVS